MPPRSSTLAVPCLLLAVFAGCSSPSGGGGTGGATGSGGATGGTIGTGGSATGGSGTGGSATGGSGTGGSATGGSGTGGSGTGGSATGGAGGTVAGTGGAAGAAGGQGGKAGQGGNAGAPATGGSGGTSSGSCTHKLCEDFESGTSGGVPTGWDLLKGYGSSTGVGLATDAAHGGSMSLKSNSSTTGQARVEKSLTGLGATATKHWGRIFYKVQSPAVKPSSGVLHITLTALENPGTNSSASSNFENRVVDTVEDSNGKHQWIYNVPDDSCCTGSTYDWSFDANWHCAEWYVDQSTQSYRFFTDGTEVTQIGFTNNSNAKMMAWDHIAVGAIFYQTPPAAVVIWFDDLAIDDKQIGCK
jgi:hypothetical protein